jgi:hypothetical protein
MRISGKIPNVVPSPKAIVAASLKILAFSKNLTGQSDAAFPPSASVQTPSGSEILAFVQGLFRNLQCFSLRADHASGELSATS